MKIARRTPFDGPPRFTAPSVFCAAPGKPFLYRIPVLGKRPIHLHVFGLPDGLSDSGDGILKGKPAVGIYPVTITAQNELGQTEHCLQLIVAEHCFRKPPIMGFCSWNAYGNNVTQEDILQTGRDMLRLGLADYGYGYVNLDSSWQGNCDPHGVIVPNEKFPDMKAMCDELHGMGFRAGIYSSPMRTAWGAPPGRDAIPGCTRGERDLRFAATMGGIGREHHERENALQWAQWGFDYLKYDWSPTDAVNADLMRRALWDSGRDFSYCVTVKAALEYADYWKTYCTAWRCCLDSNGTWDNLLSRILAYTPWKEHTGNGHYFDLDMLEFGEMSLFRSELTDDEKIVAYTARILLLSPIQLSCRIGGLTEFELDLICNEEVIALHQDGLMHAPTLIDADALLYTYRRPLENGDIALAFFNLSEQPRRASYVLPDRCSVRDVWRREGEGECTRLQYFLPPHTVKLLRLHQC